MAGGYGTGDGVPEQDGDGAERPGPLPPRIVPPGSAWGGGYPGRPPSGAGATASTAQPTFGAGHRGPGTTYPAPADHAGPPVGGARGASPVVPTQPSPGAGSQPASGPAYPSSGPAYPSSGPAYPSQPASGAAYPSSGPAYPAQPTSGPASSSSGSTIAYPGPAYPTRPNSGPARPGQSAGVSYPAQPAPPYPERPAAGAPYPGSPISGPAYPGQPAGGPGQPGFGVPPLAGHPERPRRRGALPLVALALAGVLAVITGVQAYQIHRLDDRLAAADRRAAEAQGVDARRLDGLEQRAGSLEKQAGAAFNPEAVASAVLPSVFRVRAGQFTGTAFAVGKAPAGGGTTLLTNFHVVESVFAAGERKVFLERTDQRFEATIIDTDKDKDLARLRTTAKFSGLVAARAPVKSGQQIVVVGAPLGLQDSVTTGVVSAFRPDEGGSGPVIQFDAPINPGNSGGPVINGSKEVVGIATAKARDAEGIGLAVPIKTACDRFKLC
ncbi:trypsin-like peptidase domain-containing protein [Micromonospora sp. WMMD998]|uniref:trypsin-like peptidase domain-containing protein n=1 Tax=Micromonospora sp. WMMD998 TaxID=3016092 RepID=UPI00249B87FE|nr:trypsin-like peptidase domain-containing protein [Micromonospora sp. WMMD998]WFE39124.1 trypsin-like peptidase domain-containing protein [Micromonospora sp. WMMD998]